MQRTTEVRSVGWCLSAVIAGTKFGRGAVCWHRVDRNSIREDAGFQGMTKGAVDNAEQLSILGVPAQFPNHHAPELLMPGIADFVADGDRVFIGPKSLAVKKPWRLRAHVAVRGERRGNIPNVMVRLIGVDSSACLEKAVIHVAHRRPTVAIKRNAHEEFRCRNPGGLV